MCIFFRFGGDESLRDRRNVWGREGDLMASKYGDIVIWGAENPFGGVELCGWGSQQNGVVLSCICHSGGAMAIKTAAAKWVKQTLIAKSE